MVALTNQLVARYDSLLASVARQIARKLPVCVEHDDLVAFGRLGLMQAASRFRSTGGASFETFVYYRVRGAMLDGVQKMVPLPPAARRWIASQSSADALVEEECLRSSEASSVNTSLNQARRCIRGLGIVFLLSQSPAGDGGEAWAISPAEGPSASAETRELVDRLQAAIQALPPAQQEIIEKRYYEGKTFAELAELQCVNKSTITRRHVAAIDALRAALEPMPSL